MATNQRQIASTLNLSVATISRSLKNDQAIHPRTRALVLETARQMGYEFPSLQTRSTGTLEGMKPFCAVVQSDSVPGSNGNDLLSRFMTGLSEGAFRKQTSMITHYIPLCHREFAADQEFLPKALTSGMAEGVVLIHYYPAEVIKKFSESFPCVSLFYDYRLPYMDVIGIDQESGMAMLLNHLVDYGHRKIAFVGRDGSECSIHRNRLGGFMTSLLGRGLEYYPENMFVNDSNAFEKIVSGIKNGKFTALVCADDELGNELMIYLTQKGIRVPEDISLTGVDSIPAPKGFSQLTSLQVPAHQIGLAAVLALKERIANPAMPARKINLDCSLVKGETVGSI